MTSRRAILRAAWDQGVPTDGRTTEAIATDLGLEWAGWAAEHPEWPRGAAPQQMGRGPSPWPRLTNRYLGQ